MDPSGRHERITAFLALRPGAVIFSLTLCFCLVLTRTRLKTWEAKVPGGLTAFSGRILDAGTPLPGSEGGRKQRVLLTDGTPVMVYLKEGGRKGDLVEGLAVFSPGEGVRNPGGFSERRWLWSRGAAWTGRVQSSRLVTRDGPWLWLLRLPDRIREESRIRHQAFWQEGEGPLLLSLAVGDSRLLSRDQDYRLKTAGLSHLTSVSGTHLLFILGPFQKLTRRLSLSRRSRRLLIFPLILLPGILSGWRSGICRASLMALALEMDGLTARHRPLFNSLFWTASFLLAIRPFALYDMGFWMSFMTAGAVSMAGEGQAGPVRRALKFSLAAQTAILPYQILSAPGIQTWTPLANLLALPLAAFITAAAYLALALMTLFPFPWLAGFFSRILSLPAGLLLWVADRVTRLPFSFIPLKWALLTLTPFLALILFVPKWAGGRQVLSRPRLSLMLAWLLALILLFLPAKGHQVIFLDVGQGDASLLISQKGDSLLIDGGDLGQGYDTVIPAARMKGLNAIDLAIVSHGHKDHAQGMAELIGAGFIRRLCLPAYEQGGPSDPDDLNAQLIDLARRHRLEVIFLKTGDRIQGRDYHLEVLYPDQVPETQDLNRYSLVLKLSMDGFDLLMTGDLTGEGERALLASGGECSAHFLHLAHHGSGYSSTPSFLDVCRPGAALISVAARNLYGHPHPDLLDRLTDRGIEIYRTDRSGAVFLKIEGGRGRITTWLPEP